MVNKKCVVGFSSLPIPHPYGYLGDTDRKIDEIGWRSPILAQKYNDVWIIDTFKEEKNSLLNSSVKPAKQNLFYPKMLNMVVIPCQA